MSTNNGELRDADNLSPEEAAQLEEGDLILHNGEIVEVEKTERGFGVLRDGEVLIWAHAEGEQGRGIPIRKEK